MRRHWRHQHGKPRHRVSRAVAAGGAPEARSAAAGSARPKPSAPNWPKDPDDAAPQGRDRRPQERQQGSRANPPVSLTPAELAPARPPLAAAHQQRPDPAGHHRQQSDPEPVAARLHRRPQRPVRRQQDARPRRSRASRRGKSLTQPPSGYQTPSPNFAYGTGPKESLNKEYDSGRAKTSAIELVASVGNAVLSATAPAS